jgi:hypothetical protein
MLKPKIVSSIHMQTLLHILFAKFNLTEASRFQSEKSNFNQKNRKKNQFNQFNQKTQISAVSPLEISIVLLFLSKEIF